MYTEKISFENGYLVSCEVNRVCSYHLHCHENVIEVLALVKGSADVKVSFEDFIMREGDFIVINKEDSHSIYPQGLDCEVISLYFDIEKLTEHIPYLGYVLFACESFDLVKYKNENSKIREKICRIIFGLLENNCKEKTNEIALEFIRTLANDYDMRNYYSRNWDAGFSKVEKYYKIMQYLYDDYHRKNLAEYIAMEEFYSKSYITHLFKAVGASSFQDILIYFRLYKSEKMLLDSEESITSISDKVGFSDIKYYTKNFKKWFGYNPSEYRIVYQPEVLRDSIYKPIPIQKTLILVKKYLNINEGESEYRRAITPLNVDTGVENNLVEIIDHNYNVQGAQREKNQIWIEINEKTDLIELVNRYNILVKDGNLCGLVIYYKDINAVQLREFLMRCADVLAINNIYIPKLVKPSREKKYFDNATIQIIVMYYTLGERDSIITAIKGSEEKMKNLDIKPTMVIKM